MLSIVSIQRSITKTTTCTNCTLVLCKLPCTHGFWGVPLQSGSTDVCPDGHLTAGSLGDTKHPLLLIVT